MESTSSFPDPMQMWREAVTKLEQDVNTMATESMKTPEVARSLQQVMAVSTGMQQSFEQVIEAYLHSANLPTRKDVDELSEKLDRIEEKLDRLQQPEGSAVPRPARTRRPPSED